MPRQLIVGVAAFALALASSSTAAATWSPSRTFSAAQADWTRMAVNGRGDAAVAWATRSPARVRVTLLPAHGPIVTRVLSRRASNTQGIVLDERGGATVIWNGPRGLYGSHGPLRGRWSAPQLIAGRSTFGPALAVSRNRTVLIVWTNTTRAGPGSTGVAWRSPGHGFASRRTLTRPRPGLVGGGYSPQSDNGAAFDARGNAYLWSSCDGVVRSARPRSRRLSLVKLADTRVHGFDLAVADNRRGIAAWSDGGCTTDITAGSEPGPVRASAMRAGTFGAAVTLSADESELSWGGTRAIAIAGDGALVTWPRAAGLRVGETFLVVFGADGMPATRSVIGGGREPIGADGGGDLLFAAPYVGLIARPRGGSDEPMDRWGLAPGGSGSLAIATTGRGFGTVWDPDTRIGPGYQVISPAKRLSISLWRP